MSGEPKGVLRPELEEYLARNKCSCSTGCLSHAFMAGAAIVFSYVTVHEGEEIDMVEAMRKLTIIDNELDTFNAYMQRIFAEGRKLDG